MLVLDLNARMISFFFELALYVAQMSCSNNNCNDVASCLGICNENGIVTCGFQTTLNEIQCDTNKTYREMQHWRRRALGGIRTWLIVLTVVLIIFFIIGLVILWKSYVICKRVTCCEEILMKAPWIPIQLPPPPPPLPERTEFIIEQPRPQPPQTFLIREQVQQQPTLLMQYQQQQPQPQYFMPPTQLNMQPTPNVILQPQPQPPAPQYQYQEDIRLQPTQGRNGGGISISRGPVTGGGRSNAGGARPHLVRHQ